MYYCFVGGYRRDLSINFWWACELAKKLGQSTIWLGSKPVFSW